MNTKNWIYKIFHLMNILSVKAYFTYRILYHIYKTISDRQLLKLIKTTVLPGMQALDIGANSGFFTVKLSRLVGAKGKVYAFEPESGNYARLQQNVRNRNNVVTEQKAVAEKSGTINLYISEYLNVDHQTYDNGENRRSIDINAITVDDYFTRNESLDFVKIDAQGFDCHIIKGMRKTITRLQNIVIVGELWPYGLRKAGSTTEEYLNTLETFGLTVRVLSRKPPSYWCNLLPDDISHTNFVAVKGVDISKIA